MNFNTWTLVLFLVEAVGGISVDLAQYTPEGSLCLVQDVRNGGIIGELPADLLQLRFGAFNIGGVCQLFSECIGDGNLSLKCEACSDGQCEISTF